MTLVRVVLEEVKEELPAGQTGEMVSKLIPAFEKLFPETLA